MVSITMRTVNNSFVNNYCKDFDNLKIDEDRYLNAVGRPVGFQSDDRLSRQLTYVLRHGANSDGFKLRPGGFIDVDQLLEHRRFRDKCNVDDFKRIVTQDEKGRFQLALDPHTGALQIRANQGHTIRVEDDGTLLQKVTREHNIMEATHGTSPSAWMTIKREGLSRMKRNHIHMVPDGKADPTNPHLPGIRQHSLILIVIDVHRALFDGIEFFRSRNGVLLSPGDSRTGRIGPQYFKRVINVRTGEHLLDEREPTAKVLHGHNESEASGAVTRARAQPPQQKEQRRQKQPVQRSKERNIVDKSDSRRRCGS